MKISYNWLQEFFPKPLPAPQKLAEILALHVFEIESVKKVGKDTILDVDVLASRGYDCLSHLGIAREISAILNIPYKSPFKTALPKFSRHPLGKYVTLEIKNTELCPRYSATLVMNVKVVPSPKWVQDRLKAFGFNPINNVVDATNYVMLEMGQPLHAFDFEKIDNANTRMNANDANKPKKIIVRTAKQGEKLKALDGNTYELNDSMLVIADSARALALAGVIGGEESAIFDHTKNVLIESANFDRKSIYNTARKLGIRTESSTRFAYGVDQELALVAQKRAGELLKEWAQGQVVGGVLDIYPNKAKSAIVGFDKKRAESLLGVPLGDSELLSVFKRLSFSVKKSSKDKFQVAVPTFRGDIMIHEDLVEEIGRIMGYENVSPVFPKVHLMSAPLSDVQVWSDHTKRAFESAGFSELYGYSFVSEDILKKAMWDVETCVSLENPISKEYEFMRPHLTLKMIEGIGLQKHIGEPLRFFELGKVFSRNNKNVGEKSMLAALILLPNGKDEAFFEMKGAVTSLLERMGISQISFDSAKQIPVISPKNIWHPVRSAEIKVGQEGTIVGFMGEVSPKVLANFKIKDRVVVCEFDFDLLTKEATEEKEYRPISKYPSLVRDIAMLVPTGELAENVEDLIDSIGGGLVYDTDLFDIYEGKGIPQGTKNLAYHIVYQAEDRTLSEKEVDVLHKKIEEAMRGKGWEVR